MITLLRIASSFLFASLLQASTGNLGITLGVNNKVGIGTFLPREKANYKFLSTLVLTPHIMLGPIYNDKKIKLSAEANLDFEWLLGKNSKPALSSNDLVIKAAIKNALEWQSSHISITPAIEAELPFSKSSGEVHKILGLGINTALVWSNWGLSLSYKPSVAGYIYGSSQEPQTLATIKNTLLAGYALDNHTVNLAFRIYHSFLRNQPQELKISTLGYVEYIYNIPARYPISITVGLSSLQPIRNQKGTINFPFYDFFTPANNYSQFYFNLETVFS